MHCISNDISIPDELAIAGFSGLESGQHLPLKLTTIQTSRYEIGRRSARIVMAELSGEQSAPVLDLGFSLTEGETA